MIILNKQKYSLITFCIAPLKQKNANLSVSVSFFNLKPGSDLLSHGESPHYHRHYNISLLSSAWIQVVLLHSRRQDYPVYTLLLSRFCFSQCICLFCLYSIVFSCSFFDASRLSLNLTQAVYLLLFFLFAFLAFRFSSCVWLFTLPAKTLQRCIVKPLGQLVLVSSTAHTAYTPSLSTS